MCPLTNSSQITLVLVTLVSCRVDRYVLLELLKNALRATVETHRGGEGNAMPKVQVMIASGEQDVTFKIVDEGGGIKRSELKQVWTYLHSSAARPPIAEDLKKDNRHNRQSCALAGYGICCIR